MSSDTLLNDAIRVPITRVFPNDYNPNEMSDQQEQFLRKFIKDRGFNGGIVVRPDPDHADQYIIVDGEHRYNALKDLGATEVLVHVCDISETEAKTDTLNYNLLHGTADPAKLADLLACVEAEKDRAYLEDAVAMEAEEIESILYPSGRDTHYDDEDVTVDDHSIETDIQPGDIYRAGTHLIICGDSTDPDTYTALLRDGYQDLAKVDICFTSPPYNAGSLNIKRQNRTGPKYIRSEDERSDTEYLEFLESVLTNLTENATEVFFNIGLVENNKRQIVQILANRLDRFKDIIYWKKTPCAPHIQPGIINNQVEFILCFGDGKRKFQNAQFGQGTYWNVIEGPSAVGNAYAKVHKATFPVYLPKNIIENFCPLGGTVLDPFLGTGTTMIAAEQTGRACYGIDITPEYCQIALDRWQKLTGQVPEYLGNVGE